MAGPVLGERELAYTSEAIRSGWISSLGRYVTDFEARFSEYCGVHYGIGVSNGTAALHVALASLGVGPGDEVIIPTLTHVACANMVKLTGAKPLLADSEWNTWGVSRSSLEIKITPRTKAIMVVHLYGHPVDMSPILEIAERRSLAVIEDAAEAHGAEYRDRKAGGLGTLGCFSFYANKIITTGEGGMVVTDDPELALRCRKLRDQAYENERRFWHTEMGYNYRLTNVQAAIGVAQLERIEEFIETRRRNARLFNQLLQGVPGVSLPPEADWARNVYWMYSIVIGEAFGMTRDALMDYLRAYNIESRPFFYPVHLQPLYRSHYEGERFPVAEMLSERGLNLPSGNELTEKQVHYIAGVIRSAAKGKPT